MRKLTKGQLSKQKIIYQSRDVFNKKGSQITIQDLALELGEGVSYITNHYRTKDHLIVAIAIEYEEKYYQVLQGLTELKTILDIAEIISTIMDLQLEYRCAILATVATGSGQKVMFKQIQESYKRNVSNFAGFLELLVTNGLLTKEVLEKECLSVLRFQYVNLHTTWVVSLELYDYPQSYKSMKRLYLKGILNCFLPYLTTKGSRQYESIDFKKFK